MNYKIGILAKQFGITPQAIRFYEKEGLFPAVNEHGNTRKYKARNIKWLSEIRRYHLMGLKTEDIKCLSACSSISEMINVIAAHKKHAQNEISQLRLIIKAMDKQINEIDMINKLLFKCEEVMSPELFMVINQKGQELDISDGVLNQLNQWAPYLPFIYNSSIVCREALLNEDKTYPRKSGYCIDVVTAKELGLFIGSEVKLFPSRRCIHTIVVLDSIDMTARKIFPHIIEYLKEHGLSVESDIFGQCIAVVNNGFCKRPDYIPLKTYFEYWIPID